MYKPSTPFNVPLLLLNPVGVTKNYGVTKKKYPEPQSGMLFYGSFRTFGGTEREINGVFSVLNTAVIETWYRPDIKADSRVYVPQTGELYEIIGTPENIGMRNQYLKFKVSEAKGGA